MAWSLLSPHVMTVIRIVKLVDGEELVSVDDTERPRPSVMDDPRRAALERRRSAKRSARTREAAHLE